MKRSIIPDAGEPGSIIQRAAPSRFSWPVDIFHEEKTEPAPSALLQKLGITREDVERAVAALRPPTREEIRHAAANAIPKGSCGRGGLPKYAVATMYEDYQRLGSLSQVAKLYRRTRQSMWDIFRRNGYALRVRNFGPRIEYRGRVYTPGKDGYYRDTIGRKNVKMLHRQIWEDNHGPIPAGHQVSFRNADKTDFRPENLICATAAEITLYHHKRHLTQQAAKNAIPKKRRMQQSSRPTRLDTLGITEVQ